MSKMILSDENSSLRLAVLMNNAESRLKAHQLALSETDEKISSEGVQALQQCSEELTSFIHANDNIFNRFFRNLLSSIGIITKMQKVILEIKNIEMRIELTSALSKEITAAKAEAELIELKEALKKNLRRMNFNFSKIELEANLNGFYKNKLRTQEVEQYIDRCKPFMFQLFKFSDNFSDDKQTTELVNELKDRYHRLQDTIAYIKASSKEQVKSHSIIKSVKVGGIQNGGNTCYVASALQVINAVEPYRELFNPIKNPLKQHVNESANAFQKRRTIQENAFMIIETVSKGETVSRKKINGFRTLCFNYTIPLRSKKSRLIESKTGQASASELVRRLLELVDYEETPLKMEETHTVANESNYTEDLNLDNIDKSKPYEELNQPSERQFQLATTAYNYAGASVDMQQIINDFWIPENNIELRVKKTDREKTRLLLFSNVTTSKRLVKSECPRVLTIDVMQLNDLKAKIRNPEIIYPGGIVNGQGDGPRYRLVALIEHRPGHYVAHRLVNGQMMIANDSSVSYTGNSTVPGEQYYYVLEQ